MNRFEQLRYEKNLTQEQVAAGAGVSVRTVVRLERGTTAKPNPAVVNKLAAFYAVSIAELAVASEPSSPSESTGRAA